MRVPLKPARTPHPHSGPEGYGDWKKARKDEGSLNCSAKSLYLGEDIQLRP